MSQAAISILVWGIYLTILGPVLLLAPNFILGLFGIPLTTEVWIRVLGVIVTALGYYHIQAARENFVPFFHWSTQGRGFAVICFVSFVALRMADPVLLLFASGDFAGAIWTGLALRKR